MQKKVKVFLDDQNIPLKEFLPPASFKLDTTKIPDGPHFLKIVATSSDGVEGVKKVNFVVRNGPEIALVGLKERDVVSEQVNLSVNAYGSENQRSFMVSGAETPKAVPAWLWVMLISFVSWAAFYLITYWNP